MVLLSRSVLPQDRLLPLAACAAITFVFSVRCSSVELYRVLWDDRVVSRGRVQNALQAEQDGQRRIRVSGRGCVKGGWGYAFVKRTAFIWVSL